MTTCYIWGYNNRYPVARVDNISFQDLETNAAAEIAAIATSNSSSFIEQQLSAIRNNLPLKVLMQATLYKPGAGPEKVIDANGRHSSFYYDDFNRLLYVKDQDGNRVQQYEYNFNSNN